MALALDPRYVIELQPSRGRIAGPAAGGRAVRSAVRRSDLRPRHLVAVPAAHGVSSPVRPTRTGRNAAPEVRPRAYGQRVYLRRRVMALALLLAVVVGSLAVGRGVVAQGGDARTDRSAVVPADQTPATYLAQPGDTLWSIAERFSGSATVASSVDELVDANGSASIQAGQSIVLP